MTNLSLQNRDYVIILAKTRADQPTDAPGFAQRWEKAHTAIVTLAQHCETLDPDGITLYVSCGDEQGNCQFLKHEQVVSTQLLQIIADNYPPHRVDLSEALDDGLDSYFERKQNGTTKTNGEMILILLDGEPSDRMTVAKSIVHATEKIEEVGELGIGFVQIGDDIMATGFFRALDENLKAAGAQVDIVDTCILTTIEPESLTQFLLNVLQD